MGGTTEAAGVKARDLEIERSGLTGFTAQAKFNPWNLQKGGQRELNL